MTMNDFGFIPFKNFKLNFEISILAISNFNSNTKSKNFNIAVTYIRATKIIKT
jgi:hypothetical protein